MEGGDQILLGEGLVRMEGGDQILPFVRCHHSSHSVQPGSVDASPQHAISEKEVQQVGPLA